MAYGTPEYAQIEFLERRNAELEDEIEQLRVELSFYKAIITEAEERAIARAMGKSDEA